MVVLLSWFMALAPLVDACDRRADIEAIRAAAPAVRTELRQKFDDEVKDSSGRAHACAAAVAAAAALLGGDKARALVLLGEVVTGLPELGASLAPHRALLLAEQSRVPEAEAVLGTLPHTALAWRARIELALARARNDAAAVTSLLKKQASRDADALGELCDGGDDGACRDLLLRHAGHPAARAREAALTKTIPNTPGRTRALLGAGRPRRAAAESAGVVDADGIAARVDALLRLGLVTEAIEISDGAIDSHRGCEADGGELASLDYALAKANAKARTRAADWKGALARYDEILSFSDWGQVDKKELAEAAFFAAFTLIEADDVDGALGRLERAAVFVVDTPWEVPVLWHRAFLWLSVKSDAVQALALFDTLTAMNDKEVRKHRYWRARALDLVDAPRAHTERLALMNEDPLDWYGLLARRDLKLAPINGSVVPPQALQKLLVVDDDVRVIRLLFALGFDDEARASARARGLRDARVSLANLGVSQGVNDASFGWRRGSLYLPTPATTKNRLNPQSSWRVSYAAPWPEVVDAAAARAGIPASFIYSIMRTESGFDVAASSSAGARGVLQLLPSVARGLAAKDAGLPQLSTGVDDDIALGAALLGLLVKEHGSLLVAAAAYNGAPENAQAWVKRFGHSPVDIFVERVPYKETRDYIKKVLAGEAIYRGLEGSAVSLNQPEALVPAATFSLFPYDE